MMIGDLVARTLDLVIARGRPTLADPGIVDRLSVEVLFRDELAVVAGAQKPDGQVAVRSSLPNSKKSLGSCRRQGRGTIRRLSMLFGSKGWASLGFP